MANTKVFDNDVVEYETPETGEYKVETDSTVLVDRGEELQTIEENTNIFLEEGTEVYIPNDGETQVYNPDKPEETKIWSPENTEETKIWDNPTSDNPSNTQPYDSSEDTDWPTPNFTNPEINTIKNNYDWMFQKSLESGASPKESAEAASEMAMTMADVVDRLE
ncbi:MAG: hypothetical protein R6V35_02260 [Candidatus Nanohaloarchaea archaeon]